MTSPLTFPLTRPLTYSLTKPLGTIMGQSSGFVPFPRLRSTPSGFTWSSGISISKQQAGTFTTTFSIQALKPTGLTDIFVNGSTGNDANTGLSSGQAFQSIHAGIAKAVALGTGGRLLVTDGDYKLSAGLSWNGQLFSGASTKITVEPTGAGRVRSIQDVTIPAFVATTDPNIYVSTYTTEVVSPSIIDLSTSDAQGVPGLVWPVLAVADRANPWTEINAMWTLRGAASFLDTVNKKTYVRLWDNRTPNSSVLMMTTSANAAVGNSGVNKVLWMDRVSLFGGIPLSVTTSNGVSPKVYGNSIQYCFGVSAGNGGLAWGGAPGECYNVGSYAAYNALDGFNYHGSSISGPSPKFYEENCIGDWNGWGGGGNNNGSTCHDTVIGIRVNGKYRNNADRSIHDITSAQTWNLGCESGPNYNTNSTNFNWGCGNSTTDATKLWLDTCTSTGKNPNDAGVFLVATLKYADMDISGWTISPNTGTVATYTP